MAINLTTSDIVTVLPKVRVGLEKYSKLQDQLGKSSSAFDADFRQAFNAFYRVRRNAEWRSKYFDLMARSQGTTPSFPTVLKELKDVTGRCEASFASKLVATLDPSQPVIDSVVLGNVGLRLPSRSCATRMAQICDIHRKLSSFFAEYLATATGTYLSEAFLREYPEYPITRVKMLDLVLWQTRA